VETKIGDVLVALADVYGRYEQVNGSLSHMLVKISAGSVLTVVDKNTTKKTVDVRVVGVERVLTIHTMRGVLETEWTSMSGDALFRPATLVERVGAIPC